jgi:hypothetical protein
LTSHEPPFTLFEDNRRAKWPQRDSLSQRSQKANSYTKKTISLRSEGANDIVEIKYKSILITARLISIEELSSPLI